MAEPSAGVMAGVTCEVSRTRGHPGVTSVLRALVHRS